MLGFNKWWKHVNQVLKYLKRRVLSFSWITTKINGFYALNILSNYLLTHYKDYSNITLGLLRQLDLKLNQRDILEKNIKVKIHKKIKKYTCKNLFQVSKTDGIKMDHKSLLFSLLPGRERETLEPRFFVKM